MYSTLTPPTPSPPPSKKSELPLFGCFLRGEGGCSQAICLPFCLAFVRTHLNLVPRAFSFLREKPWGRGCTYLHVLKLSVFEKIRVHLKRIQIFFAQNTQTREILEYPLQGMRCVKNDIVGNRKPPLSSIDPHENDISQRFQLLFCRKVKGGLRGCSRFLWFDFMCKGS